MTLDLTLNLPLILTVVVTVWSASASLSGRFSRLEERLAHLAETLATHTEQEEKRLHDLDDRLHHHAADLQSLHVDQARLETRLTSLHPAR